MELISNDKNPKINSIGVLTSGGDAPGMNAAIRAVVRAGLHSGYTMYGINRGYHGLINGEIFNLDSKTVSEKLQRGGTFLMTARSATFKTPEGNKKGCEMAKTFNIDVLVVIGGDGSFRGAYDLANLGLPVIGIPGTIDNDISSTDYTIGYDTAMNTAMEAIDRLRDTSASHERCSVIEVMGRHAGYIALNVGMACGAEAVLIPEVKADFDFDKHVVKRLMVSQNSGKRHHLVVVAEGAGSAVEVAKLIEEKTGIVSRATVLGHLQRGGSPTIRDRMMASLMGVQAVNCINANRLNRLIVFKKGEVQDVDIAEGISMKKTIESELLINTAIIAM